jgi:hypothetical protein
MSPRDGVSRLVARTVCDELHTLLVRNRARRGALDQRQTRITQGPAATRCQRILEPEQRAWPIVCGGTHERPATPHDLRDYDEITKAFLIDLPRAAPPAKWFPPILTDAT